MAIDYAALERKSFGTVEKRDYMNAEPIVDPLEALVLLYTDYFHWDLAEKRLISYTAFPPRPRGVGAENYRFLPFIEHSWGAGAYGLKFGGANDYLVSHQVVQKLIDEGWIMETSDINVYKISLLGRVIACAAQQEKKRKDASGT